MAEVVVDLEYDLSCVHCLFANEAVQATVLLPVYLHGISAEEMLSFVPLCDECANTYPKDRRASGVPVIRIGR